MPDTFEVMTTVDSRIEDPFPDCEEKKDFEKHLDAYYKKLMRCNVCWHILGCITEDREGYRCAAEKSPCFWNTAIYGIKMSLITDIVSFISNDKESIINYLKKVEEQKDKIFPRRFFSIVRNIETGEVKEIDDTPRGSIDAVLRLCRIKLLSCKKELAVLRKARDKVYCHYDREAIEPQRKQQQEVFEAISDTIIEDELRRIGEILNMLEAHYNNSRTVLEYTNIDDVKNTFTIMKNNKDVKFF